MGPLLVAVLLAFASTEPPKPEPPVKRLDRTKAVGAPVLDEKAGEGVYVWVEDGWFNVAAVSRSARKRRVTITVRSTKKIEKPEGDFSARAAKNQIVLVGSVGGVPMKSRFKTDGEVTVNTTQPLFVGPLSRKAAATVSIGRY